MCAARAKNDARAWPLTRTARAHAMQGVGVHGGVNVYGCERSSWSPGDQRVGRLTADRQLEPRVGRRSLAPRAGGILSVYGGVGR